MQAIEDAVIELFEQTSIDMWDIDDDSLMDMEDMMSAAKAELDGTSPEGLAEQLLNSSSVRDYLLSKIDVCIEVIDSN